MNLLDLYETREPYQQAIDRLEARRIEDLHDRMDELMARTKEPQYRNNPEALAGLKQEFQKVKDERDGYYKIKEGGIPGNVPTEKIPGKEDLLKGKGRTYYEDQKKNSEAVAEQSNLEQDDWYNDEEDQETDLRSGDYVRDTMDGESGEIFRMQGDPYERRVRILDRDGKGWYIEPSRLTRVDPQDPDVQRYFGKQRQRDMDEGINEGLIYSGNTWDDVLDRINILNDIFGDQRDLAASFEPASQPEWIPFRDRILRSRTVLDTYAKVKQLANMNVPLTDVEIEMLDDVAWDGGGGPVEPAGHWGERDYDWLEDLYAQQFAVVQHLLDQKAQGRGQNKTKSGQTVHEQGVAEAIVASGPSKPLDDRAVKKMVWDTMKINADTGEQALQRALAVLAKKPQSRMVQDLQDKFQSLADRLTQGVAEEQKPGFGEFPPKQEITIVPPKKLKSGETYQDLNKYWQSQGQAPIYKTNEADVEEGWSDAMLSRRTGQPRTPYSVYINGKKWKDFENDDHARAVMDKLKAKFKADGRDPGVITIAPTDYDQPIKEEQDTSGVERAILNRIMVAHTDLLMKYGPDKVMQAAEEVAYNVGDVDEIGTSDVSAYVAQVKQILGATP